MMLRSSVSAAVTSLALALALSLTVADSHLFVDVSLCCLSALVASPLPPLSSVCAPTDHHYYNRLLVVSLHCEGVGGGGAFYTSLLPPSLLHARRSLANERPHLSVCLFLSLVSLVSPRAYTTVICCSAYTTIATAAAAATVLFVSRSEPIHDNKKVLLNDIYIRH